MADGKLVGAVTHVFTEDPTMGCGVNWRRDKSRRKTWGLPPVGYSLIILNIISGIISFSLLHINHLFDIIGKEKIWGRTVVWIRFKLRTFGV